MIKILNSIIILLIMAMVASAAPPAPWEIDEIIGMSAPDFTLKSVSGEDTSLSSFRGKVVVLNFWATWCPPCVKEMPSLNKLYKNYKEQGIIVIAASTDNSIAKINKFLKRNPVDFIVVSDPDYRTSRDFKVFSLPTSFLIDKDGKIVKKYLGEIDWMDQSVVEEIKKLF